MIELVILSLATYGTSSLLTAYDGPVDVFLRLRNAFSNSPLHCIVCTATWMAILFFIVQLLGFGYYLMPLAIVGAVILLEKI